METAIAVYEAPIGALNPDGTWGIEFEDLTLLECDFQGEATRAVSRFTASPGPTGKRYYVQIGGRNGASGELHVTFDCDGGCPPENDNVAQAWTAPIGYEQTTDTRAATIETNEALPCGSMGKTIWYQLPVPTAGEFRVTTAGSNFPTVIAVYKVDQVSPPGGLSGAACVSVDGLTFSTDGVSSYYIQIGGADGAGGTLVTRVDCVAGCQATSPPGGASGGGGVVGPDTGSGGYLPAARRH
jgi:hypothetical protein